MKTFFQSLKKCSICLDGTPALGLLCIFFALPSSQVQASAVPAQTRIPSLHQLHNDLSARESIRFEATLNLWEERYGVKAAPLLIQIANTKSNPDPDRYIALIGAARLGGPSIAPVIPHFLKDRSWMIRTAALRALKLVGKQTAAIPPQTTLRALKDPALVVRREAIDTILALRPEGSITALLATLEDPRNFRNGRPQWVPQKSLEALRTLRAGREVALHPLIWSAIRTKDAAYRKDALFTLETLYPDLKPARLPDGKGNPLLHRLQHWKKQAIIEKKRAAAGASIKSGRSPRPVASSLPRS